MPITRRQLTPEEALARLIDLCNSSEQCSTDLLKKLSAWKVGPAASSDILRKLKDVRLVDDTRYCGAYARDKMRYSSWGRYKIKMALAAKRLDRRIIDDAVASLDDEEYYAAAEKIVRNALKRIEDPTDYISRMKLMRQCASRGFEPRLIADILDHIIKHNRDMQ